MRTADRRTAVIVGAARTAIGKFGGAFADVPAHELGAVAIRGALARSGVQPAEVEEVVLGQVGQVGPDAYGARRAALAAGLPVSVTAHSVNRLCGSGLQAIWTAARAIAHGDADVVVAGGMESMSSQPFLLYGQRSGYRLGDRTAVDGTLSLVTDPFKGYLMGETAERVAERFGISRDEQDALAYLSQRRAGDAIDAGRFSSQIEPVPVKSGRGELREVALDEHPRPEVTEEDLGRLRPVFRPEGTVTAGNSSGVNDGAAALVLMSAERAEATGRTVLGRFTAGAVTGIEPEIMGYGPVSAIERCLARTGHTAGEVDVIELNEAFAAQAVAVIRDAGLDPERVNPNGGAIALGHPIGATGAILAVKALYELERVGGSLGLMTMCIGGGQGIAVMVER